MMDSGKVLGTHVSFLDIPHSQYQILNINITRYVREGKKTNYYYFN